MSEWYKRSLFSARLATNARISLRKLQTTAAAADDNADAAPLLERQHLRIQFRVLECLTCRNDGQCRGARDMRTLFRAKEIIGIDALDFTGNLNGKRRRIESADAPDTASSVAESVPKLVPQISQRWDAAKAT